MECQALIAGRTNFLSPLCGYPYLDCKGGEGTGRPVGFVDLDFSKATVQYSNLGGLGPDTGSPQAVRLDNVGDNLDGSPLDMLITTRSAYTVNNIALNGVNGAFGQINVKIGSFVDLTLTFVASGTDDPVTVENVMMSFYDFDKGAAEPGLRRSLFRASSHVGRNRHFDFGM